MLNTNFDEKVDIVKGDLEEILEKILQNLLQLCQLLEPFHQTFCQLCLNRFSSLSSTPFKFEFSSKSSSSVSTFLTFLSKSLLIYMSE